VFEGLNKGLVIAEVELTHEKEQIVLPDWIKEEVTYDARYLNSNLAKNPYLKW
jgi:adenylate cyclase